MLTLSLVLAIAGLLFGVFGSVLAALAWIEVKALKNSTHSIQYVPVSTPKSDEEVSKDFKKTGAMAEPFDEYPDEVIL